MTRWKVHLTTRDERGTHLREFVGAFAPTQLAAALAEAFRNAGEKGVGVLVVRDATPLGSVVRQSA
jgi:hypothetical protein